MTTDLVTLLHTCSPHDTDAVIKCLNAAAAEIERLRRGEFICSKCGLRKDAEKTDADF